MAAYMGKENRGSKAKAAATTRHDEGGREEMGESNTEGDAIVFLDNLTTE